jgi:predicted membrane protein
MPVGRDHRFGGRLLAGIIIIFLGLLFLLGNLYPEFDAARYLGKLWPLIIIIIGLYLIFHQARRRHHIFIGGSSGRNRVFGDIDLDYSNKEIGNADASQIVGDLKIDYSGGHLKPGINHFTISMIVGDTLLIIPAAFPLRISARTILGDIQIDGQRQEGFLPRLEHLDSNYHTAESKLFITINSIIGDMTVRRL